MIIALAILTLIAVVGAIGAASRTQSKLKLAAKPKSSTVLEVEPQQSQKPQLQADIDSERSEPTAPEPTEASQPPQPINQTPTEASQPPQSINQTPAESNQPSIVVPPFAPQPEAEMPLATSLKISDVVEPPSVEPELALHAPTNAPEAHHAASVLAEVDQLEHSGEKLDRLSHLANDTDPLIRVAAATQLGEFIAQGQELDRAVALLNQLTQDADLQVRTQAGASLARMPLTDVINTSA